MKKLTENQVKLIYIKIFLKENKYIVLVDTSATINLSSEEHNANIYCIDDNYNIFWQVKDSQGMFEKDSFVSLELASGEERLVARRFFGKKYLIDIASGSAEEIGWEK